MAVSLSSLLQVRSTGYTGSAGPQGDVGYTGSKGDAGYTGSAGSQGDIGYTGSAGAGYTGSKGDTGYTGSASLKSLNIFCSGVPANNEYIGGALAPYSMVINDTTSIARSINASSGSVAFTVYNGANSIGTVTFSTSNTGTISISANSVTANDHIYVKSPADTTSAPGNISIIFKE